MRLANKLAAIFTSIYLSYNYSPISAQPIRNMMSNADYAMAHWMRGACRDGLEHIAFYVRKTNTIEDLTLRSSPASVFIKDFDAFALASIFGGVTDVHCHVINPDNLRKTLEYYNSNGYDFSMEIKQLANVPKYLVDRRLLPELPSGTLSPKVLGGDMPNAINLEALISLTHPNELVEHRLVVVRESEPLRVVAYGLTDTARRELSKIKDAELRIENLKQLITIYDNIINEYFKTHCLPWHQGLCEEPNLSDIFRKINSSGVFFVEVIGEISTTR